MAANPWVTFQGLHLNDQMQNLNVPIFNKEDFIFNKNASYDPAAGPWTNQYVERGDQAGWEPRFNEASREGQWDLTQEALDRLKSGGWDLNATNNIGLNSYTSGGEWGGFGGLGSMPGAYSSSTDPLSLINDIKMKNSASTGLNWNYQRDPNTGAMVPVYTGGDNMITNSGDINRKALASFGGLIGAGFAIPAIAGAAGAVGAGAAAPGEAAGAFTGSALPASGGTGGAAGWGFTDPAFTGWNAAGTAAPSAGSAIPGMNAQGGWGVTPEFGSGSTSLLSSGAAAPAGSGAGGGATPTGTGMDTSWFKTINDWLPLISAVGGAFQGNQDQTTTQQTQLPPWLQALGPQLTGAAVNAAAQPYQPYPGQRVEPFNQAQNVAFGMVSNRALAGSPVERAGQDAVTRAASGSTNPFFGLDNPYLNKQVENVSSDIGRQFNRNVVPQLDQMNVRANTGFGTSSAIDDQRQEAYRNLNETTAKAANDLRYKDYYTQAQLGEGMAGRQLQAAGLAPNLGALDYRNAEALLNVGNQQQQQGQIGKDFDYSEFMRQLQYPDVQLQRMGYPFGFNQGSTSTTSTPGAGPWAGAISGLIGGVGARNVIGQQQQNPMQQQTYGGTGMTPPPQNQYGLGSYYPYQWGMGG